ncbi:MAG: transporter substrate-binding domain-containing protein, partial [Clostridia bacterium]
MQTNARLKRQFNSKFFLITVALLVIVLLCGTVFPVFGDTSSAKQTRTVRVGWWEQRGYMDISRDKDGNITRSGYMYEYLQAISQEVGWQYEFVDGSFSDLVAQTICEEPTIDIICCVFGGDGMPRGLTLPDLSTGSDFVTLYTNNDSDLNYNDIGQFDNLKIGCVSDGNISRYKEYATKNGIVFSENDFVKCSSNNEVREKLKNGYLDAAIEGGFQSNDDFRKLADFTPSPFYIAVKDKGTEPNLLLEELNKAMSLILLNNPYYNENLAKKYLTSRQQKFTLTTEEQQFVKGGVTIKVGFCNNWKPMQYVKTEGDVKIFEGVDKDILDRISELTGIRFEFIESDIVGDFNDKRVDAVLCDQEYKNIAKNDFVNTNSYFAMGLSLIRENRKPIDNTTAIPSYVYSYDTYVTSGNYEFIKCNSTEECLNLVLNGKTSQALVVTIVAQNYLNDYRYKSLSRTAMSGISYDCCIALRKNINPLVRTIINKGINFISQAEINDFVVKNTFLEQEITFERILSKLPPDVIMIFLIFLLMAIGMLVFFLIDRDKANKRINKLLFYDDVTGLLSTAGIEKLIEKELKKGKNLVLIDMKMEDFDRYLQLYGMEFSNDILRDAAKTFTSKSIHYGCAMSRLHKG